MKMKNVLLSSMLVLALGLSGCNIDKKSSQQPEPSSQTSSGQESSDTSSSSEIPPVTLIRIERCPTVVVGQAVNLDDYVTVEGGEGPKVFTATVAAASAELAVVEGHTLTALGEGDINVTISAGGLSAKFSTTAMSALKADFAEAIANVSNTWAMLELYQEQLYIGAVHRPDYSCFPGWGDNDEPGGFLKCQNGLTYSYILDDQFENIQVDPAIQSDFGNYYCNYDFCLSASDFTTTETDDGEVLVLDKHAPGAWGSSYFNYKVEEFAYTLAVSLNSNYSFGDLVVSPFTLTNADNEDIDTFLFSLPIIKNADQSTAAVYQYVFDLDDGETEITAVRNYIDSGSHPEAIDFEPLVTRLNEIVTAKNYTLTVEAGWFTATDMKTAVACPETLVGYSYDIYFSVGTETSKVTSDNILRNITATTYRGASGAVENAVVGYVKKEGTIYSISNISEGAVVDTITGTAKTGTDVWESFAAETLAPIAGDDMFGDDFIATGREEGPDGSLTISFASPAEVAALMGASELGYWAQYILSNGWQSNLLEYCSCDVTVGEDYTNVFVSFPWDNGQIYCFDMTITDVGTTVVDVPEFDIA